MPRLLAGLLATAVAAGAPLLAPTGPAAAHPVAASQPATQPPARHTTQSASRQPSARAGAETPLQVSIETLSPATVPVRGRVTLSGTVTNRSDDTWTGVKAYLLTSRDPIRSRADLNRAAATDADAQVGVRITGPGLYVEVGNLPPGASLPYRLSVRRADLRITGETGVYWFGVHVLGAAGDGTRDALADGRARTFMPLLPKTGTAAAGRARTRLALVVPLRQPVRRGGAGRLLDLPGWEQAISTGGRLDRLLRLSARASRPITWVVDPAVLEAVQSIALGNPVVAIRAAGGGPSADASGASTPSPTPSSSPTTSASGSPTGSSTGTGQAVSEEARAAARVWLDEFRRQAPTHTVATVPYGDLDLAALDDSRQSLYQRATALSATTAAAYGVVNPVPVVDPLSGYLPESAVAQVDGSATVLLDQSALPGRRGPVLAGADITEGARAPVVLMDARAGSGGPKPNSRYAVLEVRQRLLSDAALHAISGRRTEPLVVSMPADWNPGDAWGSSRFFGGLAQPWLQMVDLPSVAATISSDAGAGDAQKITEDTLVYPASEEDAEVPSANLAATEKLVRTAGILADVLRAGGTIEDALSKLAMLGASLDAREDPGLARTRTSAATGYVRSLMAKVHIDGPPFVMMSGESGPIQVTLVNDLAQSVTVGLAMSTPGSRLRITPITPVTLGPGRRTSIRLQARSNDIGVHAVTLKVTDVNGRPLGSETRFSVRTSNVSTVIWVIIGIGGALLFLAIGVRLYRRVRRRRATPGPLLPPSPTTRDRAPRPGRETV